MKYLIQYNDKRALDPGVVGRKFASLARAAMEGFEVPPGASISTQAHRYFLHHRAWPSGLTKEVFAFADSLGWYNGLSIRSSAVREDLETQSFAGQYQTFLRVFEPDELSVKIEKCWLSAETDSVRSYLQAGLSDGAVFETPLMGVILQRMVDTMAAGVAFGRNPVSPTKDEMVIEAVSGSGERLVNGHVTPYRAFISEDGEVRLKLPLETDRHVKGKDQFPMIKKDWLRIAGLLRQLEAVTGGNSLDMEWAIDSSGRLWLLQYRRITTAGESVLSNPSGVWTRLIANDLWADRLTPFMADAMVKNSCRFNLSGFLKILNIPVVEPSLTVINGYLYVNCESIRRVVDIVPLRFRTSDIRSFFPDDYDFDALPQPRIMHLGMTAFRGMLLPVLEPAINPLLCLWQTHRHWKKIERRIALSKQLPDTTLREANRKLQFALETMTMIQEKNQWPYFHAAFFTLLLRWLMVDRFGASHAHFLNLISSGGQNISIDIERHFRQMALSILKDPELAKLFLTRESHEIYSILPADFKGELKRFLYRYGCRSRHRTLYIKRWSEAPDEVIGILKALVRQADYHHQGAFEHRNDEIKKNIRWKPNNNSIQPGSPDLSGCEDNLCRLLQPALRKLARCFLDLREDLRFLLDKALYEIRNSLLVLGKISGLGDDIMFLENNEIGSLINGSLDESQARKIAAERHHRFRQPATASSFFVDGLPVEEFSKPSTVFSGIGTSPGQANGRARIVSDPSRDTIQKGDILIAQNTDPGWTPILSLVAGMVMEEGGLLNHCSIVARELKIPAIVGIRQATRKIPDGAVITIDGGLGLVRVEDT